MDKQGMGKQGMGLDQYQAKALSTVVFPEEWGIAYCALKLNGEAGEVAEEVGKAIRAGELVFPMDSAPMDSAPEKLREALRDELGDVLWYVAVLAHQLNYSLEEIATANLAKLQARKQRGELKHHG